MTATNHAVTGAVVALAIKEPALAIPVALASHFVLDAIPHFGIHKSNVFRRNRTRQFQIVLISDIALTVVLFFVLLFLSKGAIALWIPAACMFIATTPDMVWGYRFYREIKTKIYRPPKDLFSRFHLSIQWSETPKGLFVEFIWLGLMLGLFFSMTG